MNDDNAQIETPNLKPFKKVWKIGSVTVIPIDKNIVDILRINEFETLFQQEITNNGILLRLVRNSNTNCMNTIDDSRSN
jgi:hypothetical protein